MHVYDPYGAIREQRERYRKRAVIRFAILWILGLSTLITGVTLALSLAQ